jgi:O-methyltransferase involved in polyketide biosynthesis
VRGRRSFAPRGGTAAHARRDVRYVSVDFARDDLAGQLVSAGWDKAQASIFVWEGVHRGYAFYRIAVART